MGLGEHQDLVVDEVGLVLQLQQYVVLGHGRGSEVAIRWESEARSAWDGIGGVLPVLCVCL